MHLLKRNQNYYFRTRVPQQLLNYFKSNMIQQSLRTKKYRKAKTLATLLYNLLQQFSWMVQYNMISDAILQELEKEFKTFKKQKLVKDLSKLPKATQWIVEDLDMYDDMIAKYKEAKLHDDIEIVEEDIEEFKTTRAMDLNENDELKLAKHFAQANIEILQEVREEFQEGIYDNTYIQKPKTSEASKQIQTTESKPKAVHPIDSIKQTKNKELIEKATNNTLNERFSEWLIYKQKIEKRGESSLKAYVAMFKYLTLFFDKNSDISTVSSKKLKTMQQTMLMFPNTILKAKKYLNKSLVEILNILEEESKSDTEVKYLTAKRINGIFINIKSFYDYLVYEEYLDSNPVNVKALDEEKTEKTAYSSEDLKKIVHNDKVPQYILDMSLVALYSGMRIGEIVALEKENILMKNGIHFFNIVEGKTENAPREIPIHTNIVPMIQRLLKQKGTYLFNDGRYNATVKNVNYHLRKIIPDVNKSFHSFRKCFTAKLYEKHAQTEPYIKILVGHSTKENLTFDTYNENQFSDEKRINMIESVEYNF